MISDDENQRRSKWRTSLRWFAAELVVVVSGVLIALAIGSVYQDRQNGQKEERYLRQLAADLEQTENLMTASDSINRAWDKSIAALVGAYRGGVAPDRDSVLRWVKDLQFDNPVPVMGTADALIGTGDLQLISDLGLRSAVTSYLSRTREYNVPWLLSLEEEFVAARSMFRKRVDMLEVESPYGNSPSATFSDIGGTSPYPLQVGALLADRESYFLLVQMVGAKEQFAQAREAFRTDAANLRRQIQEIREQT